MKVSVLLTAYNAETYLRPAIDSILGQTLADFELIIINDGSKDGTDAIVRSYTDPRIVYHPQENHGLARSLNIGLKLARGEYIARMDADDISTPDRLELQAHYLDQQADVAVVGGSYEVFDDERGVLETFVALPEERDIKNEFYIRNPYGHGSVMFRKAMAVAEGGYDEVFPIEDYEIWWRLSQKYAVGNVPKVIYKWRLVQSGISHGGSDKRQAPIKEMVERIWAAGGPALPSRQQMAAQIERYRELKPVDMAGRFVEQYIYDQYALGLALIGRGWGRRGWAQIARTLAVAPKSTVQLSNLYYFNRSMRGYLLHLMLKPNNLINRKIAGLLRRVQPNKGVAI
jgi:hypothetical protein